MSERIELRYIALTAEEAIEQAKAWVHREPRLRLRTVASCRRVDEGGQAVAWIVTLVVNERDEP